MTSVLQAERIIDYIMLYKHTHTKCLSDFIKKKVNILDPQEFLDYGHQQNEFIIHIMLCYVICLYS